MKSLLIHSLLSGFPVNPIYVIECDNVLYTLDGSQRTSTCIEFLNNKFALSKDTPNIILSIKENGQLLKKEYEVAEKSLIDLTPRFRPVFWLVVWSFVYYRTIQIVKSKKCSIGRIMESRLIANCFVL